VVLVGIGASRLPQASHLATENGDFVPSQQPARLDSWKEIAAYLGRDVSTVIRWEKEKGLPVHRLPGGKRQAVFALKEEIDSWLTGQPNDDIAESGPPPTQRQGFRLWLRHWTAPWALTVLLLAVIAVTVYRTGRAGRIQAVDSVGGSAPEPANPSAPAPVPSFAYKEVSLPAAYTAVAGDFDQDGNLDLAVTSYHMNQIYFLRGKGDGSFAKEVPTPVGVHPDGIAVADFDGDGRLDLATGNRGSNSVSVLLGKGDGTFPSRVDVASGKDPRGVAAGDFNRDGKADAVAAAYGSELVNLLMGSVGGLEHAGSETAGMNPYQVVIEDFNSDGHLDIAVGNTTELKEEQEPVPPYTLLILLGAGDGNFRPSAKYLVGTGSTGIVPGDFNRDGKMDLAVNGFFAQGCFVLLGKGDGTFQEPVKLPVGVRPLAVATGDFDRDGLLDLVVTNSHSGTLSVFRGNGDGTFQEKVDWPVGPYPKSLVVADFNGDGGPDLVVTNFLGNSYGVLLNTTSK
jgi:hypothetical protein